eukprot:CAMPEP_0119039724 /NCGR_PEP_ID=MMETSP1177-20130426/9349_1 /TAXON_ID=2985 /ORGANISM="Ochromonas sp, Strain CCMP1899" /LENGTH=1234 /DNA_ID=CAMNT_0007003937 /DNA_START=150 /DNA_END=3854 /DNA_ORIENTATION=+
MYALTVIHLPIHYSGDWNQNFSKAFLKELSLSDTYYEAFQPLANKSSDEEENSVSTSEEITGAFLQKINSDGVDRIDLYIRISIYLRLSGYYDAHGRVLLRNLTRISHMSQDLKVFIEIEIRENLQSMLKSVLDLKEGKGDGKLPPSKHWRYAKIGAAAVVTGVVLGVTGGLAAPAIAVALASMGGGTALVTVTGGALTLASTITGPIMGLMFGTAGAGLASYKMDQRTSGIKEFEFEVHHDKEKTDSCGATVMLMISGFLGSKDDYRRVFGILPTYIGMRERLTRFYQRFEPKYLKTLDQEVAMYEADPQYWYDRLKRSYQRDPLDPKDLTGPLTAMEQSLLIQYEMEIKRKEKKSKKVKKLKEIEKQKAEKGTLGTEAAGGEEEGLIGKVVDKGGSIHGSADTEKSSEDDELSSVDNTSENIKEDNNYTEEEIKEMRHLPLKIVRREINYDVLIDKYKSLIDSKISSAFRVNDMDKEHQKDHKEGDKDKEDKRDTDKEGKKPGGLLRGFLSGLPGLSGGENKGPGVTPPPLVSDTSDTNTGRHDDNRASIESAVNNTKIDGYGTKMDGGGTKMDGDGTKMDGSGTKSNLSTENSNNDDIDMNENYDVFDDNLSSLFNKLTRTEGTKNLNIGCREDNEMLTIAGEVEKEGANKVEEEEEIEWRRMMDKFAMDEQIIDFSAEENPSKNIDIVSNNDNNNYTSINNNENKNNNNDDGKNSRVQDEEIVRMMDAMNAELEIKSKKNNKINNNDEHNDNHDTTERSHHGNNNDRNDDNNKNTSTSSWSRRMPSIPLPSIPLPSIPLPSIPFRTKKIEKTENEKKEIEKEKLAIIQKEENLKNLKDKIDGNTSIIHKYWNWPDYSAAALYDLHILKWETQLQMDLGASITTTWRAMGKQAAKDALSSFIFIAMSAAVVIPSICLSLTNMVFSLWAAAIARADQAGIVLARALAERPAGSPPVTLVGYSLGARVIFSCLQELADMQFGVDNHPSEEDNLKNPKKPSKFSLPSFPSFSSTHKNPENDINEKEKLLNTDEVYSNFSHRKENYSNMEESSGPWGPGSTGDGPIGLQNSHGKKVEAVLGTKKELRGVVMDVVILGGPICSTSRKWKRARMMTAGRLINGYSSNDLVLAISYRFQTLKGRIAGLIPITDETCPGVENRDLSAIISNHIDYGSKVKEILEFLDLSSPYPNSDPSEEFEDPASNYANSLQGCAMLYNNPVQTAQFGMKVMNILSPV